MQEVPLNLYKELRLKRIAKNNKRFEAALLSAYEYIVAHILHV